MMRIRHHCRYCGDCEWELNSPPYPGIGVCATYSHYCRSGQKVVINEPTSTNLEMDRARAEIARESWR